MVCRSAERLAVKSRQWRPSAYELRSSCFVWDNCPPSLLRDPKTTTKARADLTAHSRLPSEKCLLTGGAISLMKSPMSSQQIQPNAARNTVDPRLPLLHEGTMSASPLPRPRSPSKPIRGAVVVVTSEWLTASEAAELLRVKHRTVLKWAKIGQIPAHRLSGTKRVIWRFLKSELDAMLSEPSAAELGRIQCAAE